MKLGKSGVACLLHFTVFNDSDVPVTGLVTGDFTFSLVKGLIPDATSVTVTEVSSGSRPGEYVASFTPPSVGEFRLRVSNATYMPRGEEEVFQVYSATLTDIEADVTTAIAGIVVLESRLTSARAGYLDLLSSYLDVAVSSRLADGPVGVNSIDGPTLTAIAAAIAAIDIDSKTLQAALRLIAATTCGKSSGDPTGPVTFKGLDGTTDRVTSTMDANGNRLTEVYP